MVIKMDGNSKYFNMLQQQIEHAQKNNLPIEPYVKKQLELLEAAHDEFIKIAKNKGYDMADPHVGEIEVQQYTVMRDLAHKIGLPVERYEEMIKNVQIRIFGEENYKRFFVDK